MIGVRADSLSQPFVFPEGRQRVALKEYLDPVASGDSPYRLPPVSQPNARTHVARELKRLKAGGENLWAERVMDVDCPQSWGS